MIQSKKNKPLYEKLPLEESLYVSFTGSDADDCSLVVMKVSANETKIINEYTGIKASALFVALMSKTDAVDIIVKGM